MSLTQLQRKSPICFVVKAVLFLVSVVMETLCCHTPLEVSFCAEDEENLYSPQPVQFAADFIGVRFLWLNGVTNAHIYYTYVDHSLCI